MATFSQSVCYSRDKHGHHLLKNEAESTSHSTPHGAQRSSAACAQQIQPFILILLRVEPAQTGGCCRQTRPLGTWTMAYATGQQLWQRDTNLGAHGLQPRRIEPFKPSKDIRFVEKLTDVAGGFLNSTRQGGGTPMHSARAVENPRRTYAIISVPLGHKTVHLEVPPSSIIPREMARFIEWFNDIGPDGTRPIKKAAVRSAVVDPYFESLHPFQDDSGPVGCALPEKALSQGFERPELLSHSGAIEVKRTDCYDALQHAQQVNEVISWLTWFGAIMLGCPSAR